MTKKIILIAGMALLCLSLIATPAQATSTSLQSGSLIKASSDSVYYYGADSKRYVFPNEKTYKTWFPNFLLVIPINLEQLYQIPIGGNATYKPGSRLVKITTDPKVYWVDKQGTLRHVASESIAGQLFGPAWTTLVDDVSDAFFTNYKMGTPITEPILPTIEVSYSINQDKALSSEPDPISTGAGTISLAGSVSGSIANLNWSTSNLNTDQGFKVVVSETINPVYPGNDYHYLSTPSVRSDSWTDLAAGTYHFRVCQYLGGSCGVYSNDLVLKIGTGVTQPTDKTITLKATASGSTVNLTWTTGFTSSMGYKIVKAEHTNPIYPGDDYHYLSEPSVRSDSWTSLSAGTYHFRVCEYLGGKCGVYSNDVSITIASTTTATGTGTISLSGNVNSGIVYLNWVVKNMTTDLGFKVVYSTSANPVYPGNEYHYLSSPSVRADSWTDLQPGTYHFRTCEYLGGKCGVYSNDLTLTVQ